MSNKDDVKKYTELSGTMVLYRYFYRNYNVQ